LCYSIPDMGTLALIALLLWQVGAPSPTPSGKKGTDAAQAKPQTDKQVAQPSQSSPSGTEKQPATNTANQNSPTVKPREDEYAVRVVSTPPRSTADGIALGCTIALTLVGIVGIIIGVCTLRKIEQQSTAAEKTITLQFRPRIAIRGITIHDWNVAPFMQEPTPRIQVTIVNAGATQADIVEGRIQTYSGDCLPIPDFEKAEQMTPFSLQPGESVATSVFTEGLVTTAIGWLLARPTSPFSKDAIRASVYIAGFIRYKDSVGIHRNRGFFRVYEPQKRRFVPVEDTDYEYDD